MYVLQSSEVSASAATTHEPGEQCLHTHPYLPYLQCVPEMEESLRVDTVDTEEQIST